ncbi:MAG: KTSC domain-containing protein [Ginsengibacter sp.]
MRSALKKFLFVLLLSIGIISCHSQNCDTLPDKFATYDEAINVVESNGFKIHEIANTSKSSWITSAQYYSCDGITGYFIYKTKEGKEYIHKGVPINVWEEFKNASSKGSYYDYNIKHKYRLLLN